MQAVLIVEDRPGLRQLYAEYLRKQGLCVFEADHAERAEGILEEREIDLMLLDYMLPRKSGMEMLKEIKTRDPDIQVVVMTAFGDVKLAVEAIKSGAYDFLEKPIDLDHLGAVIAKAMELRRLQRNDRLSRSQREREERRMVGSSKALQEIIDMADQVAPSLATCLILGESGTGKELLARHIHQTSPRGENAFVSLNCASIPHELMESELFGHEKGSFTGAISRKLGLIEIAQNGTLFLDEIGDLPHNLQPKLLRAIQEGEFRRVGGNRTLKADIRLICATNRDLAEEVREGRFREDLYFRICVFPLELPPLRERMDDLPELVAHFLSTRAYPHPMPSQSAMHALSTYSWPGNIRELQNILERGMILAQGQVIDLPHLPENLSSARVRFITDLDLTKTLRENAQRVQEQLERQLITLVLSDCQGAREKAARRLGISPKTLYNRLKSWHPPIDSR